MQRLLPFRAVHFWILLTFFVQLAVTPAVSARVSTVSTAVDEVTRHATSDRPIHQEAKPISGMHDIRARPVYQHARKRAFKRALLRAQRQGVTTYRGRTYTLQQLSGLSGLPDVTRQERGPKNSDNSGNSNRNVHPCLLSWNVGGLSNTILDELMIWLALPHNRCIKIVLLQETRWQFSSEWESESWFIIHAGHSKQKGAGVMTLISKDLCCADNIRSCEIASGRILHTRIPGPGGYNSLDIINTYQHAWDQRAEANELKRKRARIIEKVDSCLQQIPWRNLCICAGDWNVQLEPIPGLVGNSTTHRPGHRQSAPDAEVMVDLIVSKQLVAANTWAGPRRRAYTFSHQGCHTQIDYVFVRRHQTTQQMRRCRPVDAFPITAWRQSGLHKPLQFTLNYRWAPHGRAMQCRKIDKDALATAVAEQSPQLYAFQCDVRAALAHRPCVDTLALHQILYDCSLRNFPARPHRREFAHNNPEVRSVVLGRWEHLQRAKYFRQFAARNLSCAWHAWHHFARFRAMRRDANRASRAARRQRVDNLLHEAEHFAKLHNTHKLYAIIRQIAPKQPYRRVKIYGEEGEILSREAEAERLRTHFASIFQGEVTSYAHTSDAVHEPPSIEAVYWALDQTPMRKAVPAHMAPGAAWRAATPCIADIVHDTVKRIWRTATVPQHFRDGWLVLTQKPHKPGRSPGDYRPLCLQCPCGKAVIRLIADSIRPQVQQYANRCPQHAYLRGRSTEGALLGVFERCRKIRQITQNAGHNVFARRSGESVAPYSGGVMLSLDLSMAFDAVPRVHIRDSLLAAGVQDSDVRIILDWLSNSTYHLQHGHVNLRIVTQRGVRQGCVLSPLIWTCFTCYLAYQLEPLVALEDLQLYADDFLWSRIFQSRLGFLEALSTIPKFVRKLEKFGLHVNLSKTAILVRMARPEGRELLRRHTQKTAQGLFLSFLGDRPLRIPIKKSHEYLGCIISFHDFEALTVQHRLAAAKNQFSRLRTVLTSTRCLSMLRRARIWHTCVWTTLIYGWTCCGCSSYLLTQVWGTVNRQLRAIARSPRHITHTTNDEVYEILSLPGPSELLQQAVDGLSRRLDHIKYTSDMVMCTPALHHQAAWAHDLLTDAIRNCGRLERVADAQGVACTVCGVYFDNESSMRKHRSRKHPEVGGVQPVAPNQIQREAVCVDGMPVCRGCGKVFHHMQTLLRHVRLQRCPGTRANNQGATDRPPPMSGGEGNTPVQLPDLVQPAPQPKVSSEPLPMIQRAEHLLGWHDGGAAALLSSLRTNVELRKELMQHCCVCRQWMSDSRRFKTHIEKAHSELFDTCHEDALNDCRGLTGAIMNPCEYCEQPLTKKVRHALGCPVLYQVAFACRAHGRSYKRECKLSLRGHTASNQPPQPGDKGRSSPSHAAEEPGGQQRGQKPAERAATEVSKAAEGQRQGGQGRQGQKTARGIGAFFRRKPGLSDAIHDDATSPTPRGLNQHPPIGQGLQHDVQDLRRRDDPGHGPQLGGPLERASGNQENGLCKEDCLVQGCAARASDTGEEHDRKRGEDQGTDQAGLDVQTGWQGTHVAPSDVERGAPEGCAMSGHGTVAELPSGASFGGAVGACMQSGDSQVPCQKTYGPDIQERHAGIHVGGKPQGHKSGTGARGARDTVQLFPMATDRCALETGATEALRASKEASAHDRRQVLTLALRNTGNSCYQNAFVMTWLWALVQVTSLQVGGHPHDGLGRCRGLFQTLLGSTCNSLAKVFAWSAVMQTWSRPQRQHDVGAFAFHALAKLRNNFLIGNWASRRMDPICRTLDTGPQHLPIAIEIPTNVGTIQDCIEAWHQQSATHALGSASPLLVLQLGRFRHQTHRHVRKYRGLLMLDGLIKMPCFVDEETSLDVQHVDYRVIAGVYHVGNTPASGHYKAFLCEAADDDGAGERGEPHSVLENAFGTDDDRPPCKLAPHDKDEILTNVYLVWLLKQP